MQRPLAHRGTAARHLFWMASRAAGIAALILSSLSVCVGLLMGGRLRKRRGADLRVTHEALSLATLAALAVHGLTLLGDGFLHPSLADVALPFVSSYKTFWTSTGIIAFWALALLGLSYYARARIGVQRWRRLHRLRRARMAARDRPLARRGHRRGPDLVPGDDRDRRPPRAARCSLRRLGPRRSTPRHGPQARRRRDARPRPRPATE